MDNDWTVIDRTAKTFPTEEAAVKFMPETLDVRSVSKRVPTV